MMHGIRLPMSTRQDATWMDSELFNNWLRIILQKLEEARRHIFLLRDNCSAHRIDLESASAAWMHGVKIWFHCFRIHKFRVMLTSSLSANLNFCTESHAGNSRAIHHLHHAHTELHFCCATFGPGY